MGSNCACLIAAICLVVTAQPAYQNHRFIGMPTAIGVTAVAPAISLVLVGQDMAGLVVGNHVRALAMSDTTRQYVDMFWELLDEILNAVLFVLIGMEVLLVAFSLGELIAAGVAVWVTLLARAVTVGLPVAWLPRAFNLPRGSWKVLTWGGMRGGISVALALSLPSGPQRDLVVALTYGVVVFSILVQGLSIGRVTRRALG